MLGALARGRTEVTGFLASEDCLATLRALRVMGVSIEQRDAGHLFVDGVGRKGLQPPAGRSTWGTRAPPCGCSWACSAAAPSTRRWSAMRR